VADTILFQFQTRLHVKYITEIISTFFISRVVCSFCLIMLSWFMHW